MRKILIAGATGYLGKYVTQAFKKEGYRIHVLVRNPEKLEQVGPHLEPAVDACVDEVFVGDVTRPESLRGCGDGVDVVFSSVGVTRPQKGATFRDVDYQGNLNLLNEVGGGPAAKFIYVSVFHAHQYEHLAIIKAHEDFVRALKNSGLDSTIMRPTGYFSDLSEVLRMAERGRVFLIGKGKNRMNPIHGADLARACVKAVDRSEEETPVGGPEVFRWEEVAELAFEVLGRPPKITHLPPSLMKGAARLLRPFHRQWADLADFFVTAGQGEGVAPSTGRHTLKAYFEVFAARREREE